MEMIVCHKLLRLTPLWINAEFFECMLRRMEEVKRSEQRATVEDLMYASVLEKFVEVGVDMLPTLESISESQETLKVHMSMLPALRYRSWLRFCARLFLCRASNSVYAARAWTEWVLLQHTNSTCPGVRLAEKQAGDEMMIACRH